MTMTRRGGAPVSGAGGAGWLQKAALDLDPNAPSFPSSASHWVVQLWPIAPLATDHIIHSTNLPCTLPRPLLPLFCLARSVEGGTHTSNVMYTNIIAPYHSLLSPSSVSYYLG